MMELEIEYQIIKQFVVNRKQERIIWELSSKTKREKVFWHFSDVNLLKKECLQSIEYMSPSELKTYLLQLNEARTVYYMGESYIGVLSLDNAIQLVFEGETCLLYMGDGIAYYQGEEILGKRPRYLLLKR